MNKLSKVLTCAVLSMTMVGCKETEEVVITETEQPEIIETKEIEPYHTDEPISLGPVFGTWFSYVEYRDTCQSMNEEQFTAFVDDVIYNIKDLGLNTLYVHAVAFTDALYNSAIYPRSRFMEDTSFDPLQIFVTKAHENDIHIEAWINPMRSFAVGEEDMYPEDSQILQWIQENNERVRIVNNRYYLNPAYPETRQLILSVVQELIDSYDVDGIHMDDYFYPSGTDQRFDAYIYKQAQKENEELSLAQFRINNVNTMVYEIYQTVKQKSPDLWYGISPGGNLQNDIELMYANPSDWVAQGTVDYLEPQIYWGFEHPTKPYEETLQEWLQITQGSRVILMPGVAAYNVGYRFSALQEPADTEWIDNEALLGQQTAMAKVYGSAGVIYYNYSSLFLPIEEVQENVEKSIVHIKNEISSW